MKAQTHLLLFLRDKIDNWKYIDSIIFLIILLIYVGFTDPCDRCMVNIGYGEMSCKDAFLQKIGYVENEAGIIAKQKIDFSDFDNLTITNLTIP